MPWATLVDLCRRHHIRRLSLFGSALRGNATDKSDVDALLEFEPGHVPGFEFVLIEGELSELSGRQVGLNTAGSLSRDFGEEKDVLNLCCRYAKKC
jgi:predicted nucleotidyltransferase